MTVEAVVHEIDPSADEPARPGYAAAGVEKCVVRTIKLYARSPITSSKTTHVRRRSGDQIGIKDDSCRRMNRPMLERSMNAWVGVQTY